MAFIIKMANPTGGKAGKGHNKTSTVQVFNTDTNCIIKSIQYKVNDPLSFKKQGKRQVTL